MNLFEWIILKNCTMAILTVSKEKGYDRAHSPAEQAFISSCFFLLITWSFISDAGKMFLIKQLFYPRLFDMSCMLAIYIHIQRALVK